MKNEDKNIFENIYKTPSAGWTKSEPPAELVELVENQLIAPCKAIDIGCGEGFYAIFLASKGFDVLGIDLSEQAIKYAKKNALQRKHSIRFMATDIGSLLQLNEKFDFVLEWSVLHHIMPPQRQDYIRDVSRILNQGGTYLSVCFSEKSREIVNKESKFTVSPVGTKLYYSSQQELEELYSPYFKIIQFKEIMFTGRHGQIHKENFFYLEKLKNPIK